MDVECVDELRNARDCRISVGKFECQIAYYRECKVVESVELFQGRVNRQPFINDVIDLGFRRSRTFLRQLSKHF